MKILVLPSWYPPNGGGFFRDQAMALLKRGHTVHVIVPEPIGIRQSYSQKKKGLFSIREQNDDGLITFRCSYIRLPRIEYLNALLFARTASNLFKHYKMKLGDPDIIHAHSMMWAGYAAYRISKRNGVPYILTEHRGYFTSSNTETNRVRQKLLVPRFRKALQYANGVTLVSKALNEKLIQIEPSIAEKTHYIPNMVDTSFFIPGKLKNTTDFKYFSLGNLYPVKGFDLLIQAFAKMCCIDEKITLRIGGAGSELGKLQLFAKELGIEKKIQFLGKLDREQVRSEMQNSNVFVLASRFEAFGVVLIEALATGTPVIATNAGGPAEIINDNVGLLVENQNVEQIAEAMKYTYQHYLDFDQKEIRQYAIEKFDQRNVVKCIEQVFKRALE